MDRGRRLFRPPRFADPEVDRLARSAWTVALVCTAVVLVWMPIAWLVQERSPNVPVVGLLSLLVLGVVARLSRAGRARLAAGIIVALLFGVTVFGIWVEGGLRGITASNFLLAVLAASLFFSGRAAWGVAAGAIAMLMLFLVLEAWGALPPSRPLGSGRILLSLLTQMAVAILVVQLSVGRIRQTQEFLRQVADTTPHGLYVYDLDEDKLVYGNAAVSDQLGYPRRAREERGAFGRVIASGHRGRLVAHAEAISRAADDEVLEVEYRAKRADGPDRWIRDRARVFDRHPDGRVRQIIGAAEDVTEARETEAALRRSHERLQRVERLEALGQLAGGVAHDFNNYLTVILGSAEEARLRAKADPLLRAAIDDLLRAARGSAELARQLLAFSRRQVLRPRVLDLNEVLRDGERLLRRMLPENVEIEAVATARLGAVRADPTQIEQVIVNLALNARDAMPSGGRLILETRNVFLDDDYVAAHPGARRGRHVLLAVSDTGAGMDEATRLRIFEPLFTTKGVTAGTGLGLATVEGIVRQSGGSIEVRSEPGRGSVFEIYLPRVEAELEARAQEREGDGAGGSERVLLVEDEALVRGFARRVLEAAGYQVTEAADGARGLEIFSAAPDAFDVVLTDVMLPGHSGPELAERVRALRPGLPVVFTSGYTADGLAGHGFAPSDHVLDKPFTPRELRRRMREALDA